MRDEGFRGGQFFSIINTGLRFLFRVVVGRREVSLNVKGSGRCSTST